MKSDWPIGNPAFLFHYFIHTKETFVDRSPLALPALLFLCEESASIFTRKPVEVILDNM